MTPETACSSVFVLGVGSVLMKDEALGVRAIEELQRRFSFPAAVELLDGGTSGIELLSYISGRDQLIIVDAIKAGHPPGTVLRVEGEDVQASFRTRISPHQIGITDLLAAAMLTGEMPKSLTLFGMEPGVVEVGLGLSEEVSANMGKLADAVVDEIRSLGFMVEPIAEPAPASSFWEMI